MSPVRFRQLTGLLFILVPASMLAAFIWLQLTFDYPAILRQPASAVLARFQAGGPSLIAAWYVFALSAAAFLPLAGLAHQVLRAEGAPVLPIALVSGAAAGLVQALGLIRWPFLVPALARAYLDPAASPAGREAALALYAAFNAYAGQAVGEHLGYLFTALWTVLIALALRRSPLVWPWFGPAGVLTGVGILAGLLEPAGVPGAGLVNAVAYTAWALWLIGLGAAWLRPAPAQPAPVHAAPAAGGA